jgi:hypothetical protein
LSNLEWAMLPWNALEKVEPRSDLKPAVPSLTKLLSGKYAAGAKHALAYIGVEAEPASAVSDAKGIYRIEVPAGEYIAACWGNSDKLLEDRQMPMHPSEPRIIKVGSGRTTRQHLTAAII